MLDNVRIFKRCEHCENCYQFDNGTYACGVDESPMASFLLIEENNCAWFKEVKKRTELRDKLIGLIHKKKKRYIIRQKERCLKAVVDDDFDYNSNIVINERRLGYELIKVNRFDGEIISAYKITNWLNNSLFGEFEGSSTSKKYTIDEFIGLIGGEEHLKELLSKDELRQRANEIIDERTKIIKEECEYRISSFTERLRFIIER